MQLQVDPQLLETGETVFVATLDHPVQVPGMTRQGHLAG
jgi:hypothetical protein